MRRAAIRHDEIPQSHDLIDRQLPLRRASPHDLHVEHVDAPFLPGSGGDGPATIFPILDAVARSRTGAIEPPVPENFGNKRYPSSSIPATTATFRRAVIFLFGAASFAGTVSGGVGETD